ncbi:MAG: 2-dehydro-3-deoxy-6-phosphogalactonate aldolase [Lentisphaeria bacterium]
MNNDILTCFKDELGEAPVIAILRGITPDSVLPVCRALAEGGVRFIEITLNSPSPAESIDLAATELTSKGIHIGAGTVLTSEQVDSVAEAGGSYIISPNTDPGVIRRTKELGLLSIPGFLTPSEAFTAVKAGADMLKCFPAGRMGAGYIKDLKAVLPADIVAVGGINADNVQEYLNAGAYAAGIGSALFKPDISLEEIKTGTKKFMTEIR